MRVLLNTGAQVTVLYRDFYDRHLKHLPLQKLDNLEFWAIGTESFLYCSVPIWKDLKKDQAEDPFNYLAVKILGRGQWKSLLPDLPNEV